MSADPTLIPGGELVAPDPTPAPSGEPPRRRVGRPTGSKTKRPNSARRPTVADAAAAGAAATSAAKPKSPGRPTVRETKAEVLHDGLVNFYVGLGSMLRVLGLAMRQDRARAVGAAMVDQAGDCAKALVAWSETNDQVRRALESLTTAGGFALVASAHAPIIMAAINPPDPSEDDEMMAGMMAGLASLLTNAAEPGTDG